MSLIGLDEFDAGTAGTGGGGGGGDGTATTTTTTTTSGQHLGRGGGGDGGSFPEFDNAILTGGQDHVMFGAVGAKGDNGTMSVADLIMLGGGDVILCIP
jgi:hypothetical protein